VAAIHGGEQLRVNAVRKNDNQKGAALILVLGALAALTVFAGAFALLTFTASFESALWRDTAALEVAARAGLEYCIWAIKSAELYTYESFDPELPWPSSIKAYPKDSEIYYKTYDFLSATEWPERRYLYYGFDTREVVPAADTSPVCTSTPVRISFQKQSITNPAYVIELAAGGTTLSQNDQDYFDSEQEAPNNYNDMHRILDFNLGRTAAGKEQRIWVYAKIVDNESRLNINTAGNYGMIDSLGSADSTLGQNLGFTPSELTPEFVHDSAADFATNLKRMLYGRWMTAEDSTLLSCVSSPIASGAYAMPSRYVVPGRMDDNLLPSGMIDDNLNSARWSALDLIDNDGDGLVDETSAADAKGYKEGTNEALEANPQFPYADLGAAGTKVDSLFGGRSEMELIRDTDYVSRAEAVDADSTGDSSDRWRRSVTTWSFDTVVAAQARVYSADYSSFGGPGTFKMDLYNSTFTDANPDNRQEFAQRLFWVLADVLRNEHCTGRKTSPRYVAGSLIASFIDYVDNDDFTDINGYSDFTVALVCDNDATQYSNQDRTIGGTAYRLGTTWTGSNVPAAVLTDIAANPGLYQTGVEKTPAITEVYFRDPDGTPGSGDEVWEVELYNPHEFSIRISNWKIYLKDGSGANLATHTIPPATPDITSNGFYTSGAIAYTATVDSVVLADATFDYAVDIFDANGITVATGRERLNWADPGTTGASDGTLGDQPATPYTLSTADVDGFRWKPYGGPGTTANAPVRLLSQFVRYLKDTIVFSYPHASQVNSTNKESLFHKLKWPAAAGSSFGDNVQDGAYPLKIYDKVKGVLGGLTVWSPMEDGYDNDADGTTDGFDWECTDTTAATWPPEALVFGKININTASKEVLKSIPIPGSIGSSYGITPDTLAQDIIDARNGKTLPAGHPFKDKERPFIGPWDVFDPDFLEISAAPSLDSTSDHMLRAAIAGVVTYRSCNYTVHIVARLVEHDPEQGPVFVEVGRTELVAGLSRVPRLLGNFDQHMLEAFTLTASEQEQLKTKLAITGRPIEVRFMQWIKD